MKARVFETDEVIKNRRRKMSIGYPRRTADVRCQKSKGHYKVENRENMTTLAFHIRNAI